MAAHHHGSTADHVVLASGCSGALDLATVKDFVEPELHKLLVPLFVEDQHVVLAMADPSDSFSRDAAAMALGGAAVEVVDATGWISWLRFQSALSADSEAGARAMA